MQRNGHDRGAISAIARELGLNRSTVLRHARMGMPLTSTDAARDWRARNLNPTQTKGNRLDPRGSKATVKAGKPASRSMSAATAQVAAAVPDLLPADPSGLKALQHAAQLGELAAELLQEGRFKSIEAPLRAAMAAVPEALRAQLALPPDVWDALVRHVSECCEEDGGPQSDEAEEMGDFWFAVAAGEPVGEFIARFVERSPSAK